MDRDTKKTIQGLTAHLFTLPAEDYLASEKFAEFCRKHDLSDAWKECLEFSRDEPDLYGSAVTKNAFGLFYSIFFIVGRMNSSKWWPTFSQGYLRRSPTHCFSMN
jgi:hypothetical protein